MPPLIVWANALFAILLSCRAGNIAVLNSKDVEKPEQKNLLPQNVGKETLQENVKLKDLMYEARKQQGLMEDDQKLQPASNMKETAGVLQKKKQQIVGPNEEALGCQQTVLNEDLGKVKKEEKMILGIELTLGSAQGDLMKESDQIGKTVEEFLEDGLMRKVTTTVLQKKKQQIVGTSEEALSCQQIVLNEDLGKLKKEENMILGIEPTLGSAQGDLMKESDQIGKTVEEFLEGGLMRKVTTTASYDENFLEEAQNLQREVLEGLDQVDKKMKDVKNPKDSSQIQEQKINQNAKHSSQEENVKMEQGMEQCKKEDKLKGSSTEKNYQEQPIVATEQFKNLNIKVEQKMEQDSERFSGKHEDLSDIQETIMDEEGIVAYDFSSKTAANAENFCLEDYTKFIKDSMQTLKKIECSNHWLFEPIQNEKLQKTIYKEEYKLEKPIPYDTIESYKKFIKDSLYLLKSIQRKHVWLFEQGAKSFKPSHILSYTLENYKNFIKNTLKSLQELEVAHKWIFENVRRHRNMQQKTAQSQKSIIESYNKFIRDTLLCLKKIDHIYPWVFKPQPVREINAKRTYTLQEYEQFIKDVMYSLEEIENRYQYILKPNQKPKCQVDDPTPITTRSSGETGEFKKMIKWPEAMNYLIMACLSLLLMHLACRLRGLEASVQEIMGQVEPLERNLQKRFENRRGRTSSHLQHPDSWNDVPL